MSLPVDKHTLFPSPLAQHYFEYWTFNSMLVFIFHYLLLRILRACVCDYTTRRAEGEDWDAFADRFHTMSTELGLARGDWNIGLRRERGPSEPMVSTWCLERMPAGHSYTDVRNILEENQLREIEFICNKHCTLCAAKLLISEPPCRFSKCGPVHLKMSILSRQKFGQ